MIHFIIWRKYLFNELQLSKNVIRARTNPTLPLQGRPVSSPAQQQKPVRVDKTSWGIFLLWFFDSRAHKFRLLSLLFRKWNRFISFILICVTISNRLEHFRCFVGGRRIYWLVRRARRKTRKHFSHPSTPTPASSLEQLTESSLDGRNIGKNGEMSVVLFFFASALKQPSAKWRKTNANCPGMLAGDKTQIQTRGLRKICRCV